MRTKCTNARKNFLIRRQKRINLLRARRELQKKELLKRKMAEKRIKLDLQKKRYENAGISMSVKTPNNFSFIGNTEPMLRYFKQTSKNLRDGYIAHFDLSKIAHLTFDAIALLLANIKNPEFMSRGKITGVLPQQDDLGRLFTTSSFLSFVTSDAKPGELKGNIFHHVHQKKVNTDISWDIAEKVSRFLFPDSRKKYHKLHPIFIECMTNTTNHAGYPRSKKYDWWLFYYQDDKSWLINICFLDFGVGVFGSMKDWRKKILNPFGTCNSERLRKILSGEVELPSRTKLKERWTGLPSMYEFAKEPEIKNFVIITNKVFADLENDIYRDMKTDFWGTFVSWEIHKNALQSQS